MPYDFASLAFVNQFIGAINTRQKALGHTTLATISVGDDVQAASFWANLQGTVDGMFSGSFWLTPFADGTPLTFSGSTVTNSPLSSAYTLSAARAAAGLNASGWRRMTSTNATAYGTMQAGDVIGDWVFNELAAMLRLMQISSGEVFTKTIKKYRLDNSGTNNLGHSPESFDPANAGYDNPSSYSIAVGRRDSRYTVVTSASLAGWGGPTLIASGDAKHVTGPPDVQYGASIGGAVHQYKLSGLPTDSSKSVEVWVACNTYSESTYADTGEQINDYAFDANGYHVTEGAWCLLETIAAGTSATATGVDPGSPHPNECPAPPPIFIYAPTGSWVDTASSRGFDATAANPVAIIRWTFTAPPV